MIKIILTFLFLLLSVKIYAFERVALNAIPSQLEREIKQKVNIKSLSVYKTDTGALVYVDETSQTLTQSQEDVINATIQNHIPNLTNVNLRNEYKTIVQSLETDDANWSNLTTAQRLTIMKKILRKEIIREKLGS